jgi:hypothetical protein
VVSFPQVSPLKPSYYYYYYYYYYYLISVSFTISEANHRLTLGYRCIASSFFTYNYISFIVLNHLFFTMSKYFRIFCICVLSVIFNIFLQVISLLMFNHLSCILCPDIHTFTLHPLLYVSSRNSREFVQNL